MLDRESPEKINAHSWAALKRKAEYISDATHDNHIGKEVLPARNYNCGDQSLKVFLSKMKDTERGYLDFREGRQSEPIARIFEEMVYSTQKGAYLTAEERDRIEQMIIARFGPNAVIRTAWHLSPDGRADLHVIMSATQPTKADPTVYEVLFGRRIQDRIAACITTDRKIVRYLNSNPHKHITHTAARDLAGKGTDKEQPHPLDKQIAEEVAEKYPNTRINQFNLAGTLKTLGHTVIEFAKRSITLICQGTADQVTRPLHKILQEIRTAQKRKAPKPLAEQIAEQWPDTRITQANITEILAEHGHRVTNIATKSISTKKSSTLPNQYDRNEVTRSLNKLLKDILAAQVRAKRQAHEKKREKAMTAAMEEQSQKPTAQPHLETPPKLAQPQDPPSLPTTTKPTTAEKTAQKVADLTEFFKASLGRIEVDHARMTTLNRAVKRMINPEGALRPEFVAKLTPAQKNDLTLLAAEYAKEIE